MKKYRIITNGQSYRIQYRWLGIWRLVTEEILCYHGYVNCAVELDTAEEAKKWVELSVKLNAEWRTTRIN